MCQPNALPLGQTRSHIINRDLWQKKITAHQVENMASVLFTKKVLFRTSFSSMCVTILDIEYFKTVKIKENDYHIFKTTKVQGASE